MPIVQLDPTPLDATRTRPEGAVVTPGQDDVIYGSDAPEAPGWADTFGAGWRQNNTIVSQLSRKDMSLPTYKEEGFDPWAKIKGTPLEEHWPSFADIHNQRAFDARLAQIQQEEADKRTLASAPWYKAMPAAISAGTLDWPSLLPGGAMIRGVKGGFSLAKTAATTGALAGVSSAAQEAALHATQQTRTADESLSGIGSSVVLGALLGAGGAKLLNHFEWKAALDAHDRFVAGEPPPVVRPMEGITREETAKAAEGAKLAEAPSGETFSEGLPQEPRPAGVAEQPAIPSVGELGAGAVKEPQTLVGFVRSLGGVKDWKGELEAADIRKRFPGLKSANGMELDKAREAAEEAGYLPAGSTPDDLVRALLSNEPVYSARDKDQSLAFHAQERAKEYEATVAQNRKEIRDAFGEGAGPDDLVDRAAHIMAQENVDHEMAVAMAAEQDSKLPEFMNENNQFVDFDEDEWTNFRGSPASVGAAAAVPASLEGNAIAGRVAAWLANASRFPVKGGSVHWNPLLRAIHSISPKVRELLLSMAENPLYLNKNMEGIATAPAAETLMKEWQGGLADATRANRSAFRDYRKNGGKLSHAEFNEAVADAMRNNDHSPIPQVQSAAQSWRAKVVDPLKNAAIKANLLPEDVSVETAASYFTRWWNRNKLIAQEPKFKHIVRSWVESSLPRWQAEFDKETTEAATTMSGKKLKDYLAKREAEYEERFGLYPGEVSSGIADDVFNTLTGRVEGGELRPELIKVQSRGPLKERTFSIPDKLIAEFLENDVERVMDRYVRTMGADVEIANKFGHLDFTKLEQEINADYARLSEQAKTEAQRTALEVSRQNDIEDIKGIWDLLRGTGSRFAHPWEQNFDHISRMVRLFNYIRLMGEASLASLSETVRPAMIHGLMPYMQTIGQLATNLEGVRLSVNEAKLAGQIAEGVLGHRMALMTEISDPYSSVTKSEAVLRSMSDIASKWNGIRLLTDAQKSIASIMTQNRILEGVGKYASLPVKERAYLAYLGIDARMAERINAQFRASGAGRIVNGVRVAGTEKWTDEMAKRIYRAAINKDVDSIITTPGVADVPLFVNTPVGAAMVQFRRFALAAHQRVLLRGLQEDQTRFLGGMIAMTALGMFTTWLKAVSANREEKLSDFSKKPGWWVGEGLDKSGVLAGAMEVSNAFEKATGYNPIKTPMQMMDEGVKRGSQKNQNRNDIGMIFGPSVGTAEDIMTAAKIPLAKYNEMRGKPGARVTKAQKNAAERLLPFNSYPIARQFLRYVINPQ